MHNNDENEIVAECFSIRRCLLMRVSSLLAVAARPTRVARALVRVLLEAVRAMHVPAVHVAIHLRACNRSFELAQCTTCRRLDDYKIRACLRGTGTILNSPEDISKFLI